MDGRERDGEIVVDGDARQRFHDARGYGRPLDGDSLALTRVEAAHLLFRGDLVSVDGRGFREFLSDAEAGFAPRFLVYKDLRDRGFYLSPAREGWVTDPRDDVDFVVYPRGKGPWDEDVLYRIRAVGERAPVSAAGVGDCVLAVVDEESDITYLQTAEPTPTGGTEYTPPSDVSGTLLDDRAVLWDPPEDLHHRGFYGRPLEGRDESADSPLQLSLIEAAYLAAEGALSLDLRRVVERGRAVEGDRFDRRLRTYRALRDGGLVPKTGFKFGADFRVYATVETVDDLGHAEFLVRVLPADYDFEPRDLALDVRLAHGVRKEMLFARHGDGERPSWLSVSRLTP
ncbi:MAG: tRNA-intron lyase [Halobacteriaceae archaeon]